MSNKLAEYKNVNKLKKCYFFQATKFLSVVFGLEIL